MSLRLFLCLSVALAVGPTALAAGDADAQSSLQAIEARLRETESNLDSAAERIDELEAKVGVLSAEAAATSTDTDTLAGQLKKLEGQARGPAAESAVKLQPYGFIKIDVIRESVRTSNVDTAGFVPQQKPGFENDGQTVVTVRQTQLGLNVTGPDVGEAKQRARVEADFYGSTTAVNKATPRLRYAYWELSYPEWSVLAGQAADVFSPLIPSALNNTHLDNSGNIGYRSPMLRYRRIFACADKTFQGDVAIARSTGGTVFSSSTLDDAGSAAGWPVFEARLAASTPTRWKRALTVGVSGHYGQQEFVPSAGSPPAQVAGPGQEFLTYSGDLDWTVPLCEKWDLNGEFFRGRNLAGFVGGIGQGVNSKLGKPIDSMGGWSQLSYRPAKTWTLSAGGGIDDPENGDLSAGDRSRNVAYFANAVYSLNERTTLGFETLWQQTSYVGGGDGDNLRFQSALTFRF